MKKIILLALVILPNFIWANNFNIDVQKIDMTVNQAKEVSFDEFNQTQMTNFAPIENLNADYQFTEKSPTTAFVLGIFLGTIGIHRLYLGTTVGVFIVYVITQAGCGALYLVDNILLLMAMLENSPIDKYIDNPHLFMWME